MEKRKKYAVVFAAVLIISVLCELFVFNFKWLVSLGSDSSDFLPTHISGVTGDEVTANAATFEYVGVAQKIKYVKIDPGAGRIAEVTIAARDEANSMYLSAPKRTVAGDVEQSKYIRLNFSGKIDDLRIEVKGVQGQKAPEIVLNTRVPLMFSLLRFFAVFLGLLILCAFLPGSPAYEHKTDLKQTWQRCVAGAVLVVEILVFFSMIHLNSGAITWHENYEHHRQHYALVESFRDGRLDIGEGSDELLAMENPYDYRTRAATGVPYKWDHAYFEGKYYSYFGVLPTVLLYLPYNLLTGGELPNYIAVFIFGAAFMAGVMYLLKQIIARWYKNTPFAVYILLSVVFPWVSVLGYAVYKPDAYLVPFVSALAFSVFGLGFWVSAKKGDGTLCAHRLCAGAACVALTAACRPQFLLTAVPGVVLFFSDVFKERTLFSKRSARQSAAIIAPFVVVGAAVMWYNFARFGSVFDFGANYNLTTNDMTHRGLVWGRTGLGIFSYFLQPIRFDAVFPFLHDFDAATTYQGLTLTEKMLGGVLWLYPVLLLSVFGTFKRKLFEARIEHRLVYICVIMAVVLGVLDAQMAGLLTRYFADFVWLLMIAVSFTVMALYKKYEGTDTIKTVTGTVVLLSAVTMVMLFLSVFARTEDAIVSSNPGAYYLVQHLVAFWM